MITHLPASPRGAPQQRAPQQRAPQQRSPPSQQQSTPTIQRQQPANVKYNKSGGPNWFVTLWQRWGFLDRALFVVTAICVVAEILYEIQNHVKKAAAAGEDGGGESAAASSSESAFGIKQAGAIAVVVGAIAIAISACLLLRKNRQSNNPAGFQLRDRNASRRACTPLTMFLNWWGRAQFFDRVLFVVVVSFLCVDGTMTLQEKGLPKVKLPQLRGSFLLPTSPPTASPTPVPPPPPEDPKEVAAAVASAATSPYAKPAECTADQIGQVQRSGIKGDECRGKPYTQACSFTQMTRTHTATWLGHFAEEVRDVRQTENTTHTFLGFMVYIDGRDCFEIDTNPNSLQFMFQGPPDGASEAAVQAGKDILKAPKLFCSIPYGATQEFEDKWGLVKTSAAIGSEGEFGKKPMDQFMIDNNSAKYEIKDVVHINMAKESLKALQTGWVTLARTRYVEFGYDWQGAWGGGSLESVIAQLDELGHTCYWPGDDKLWRITDCWQSFYGFKSYSNVACVNRNLAPKLADSMEKMFLKTIEGA